MTTFSHTLAARARVDLPKLKGSRFIGVAAPVADEAAAEALLAEVRQELPGATHYAYALRLDADRVRSSDDGEVRGTAARPLLDRLEGRDLERAMVVVVRYYGGTKLGPGGLVKAYGAAGSAALDEAGTLTVPQLAELHVAVALSLEGPLRGAAAAAGGEHLGTEWGAEASLRFAVDPAGRDRLLGVLRDRCAGRLRVLGEGAE